MRGCLDLPLCDGLHREILSHIDLNSQNSAEVKRIGHSPWYCSHLPFLCGLQFFLGIFPRFFLVFFSRFLGFDGFDWYLQRFAAKAL